MAKSKMPGMQIAIKKLFTLPVMTTFHKIVLLCARIRLFRNVLQNGSHAEGRTAFAGAIAAAGAEDQAELVRVNAELVLDAVALALRLIAARVVP